MIQPNDSHSTNGAGYSAFASAQTALARKPLPGPIWAWPIIAAVAAAGLVYLVTSGSPEHAAPRAKQESAAPAEGEAAAAAVTPAPPSEPSPAPAASTETPAAAPAAPAEAAAVAAPANDGAAAAPAAEPAKASDETAQAVASASAPTTKKKSRGARKASRKRTAQVD